MQITILYAGLIGLLLLTLSLRVIAKRRAPGGPSLGDGGIPRSTGEFARRAI